jgi:signal transduction histidine kinase
MVDRANATSTHQITVFLADGSTLGLPVARSPSVALAAAGASITAETAGGREVLVAVAGLPTGTAVIRAFVSDAELTRGVGRAWLILGLLGLSLLAVSVIVADRLSRTVTKPLSAVAKVSDLLAQGDLQARAVLGGPAEVRRVGTSLNLLAAQIGGLVAKEREAAADLSHRLRTPLTALRIDSESLSDPAERSRILAGLDALERTVNEIIRAARRPAGTPGASWCDATSVVRERAEFWSALADEESRQVDMVLDEPVLAGLAPDDLAACVDALLGNVFAHTPEGSPYVIELRAHPRGGASLVVADRGQGMPATLMPRRGASTGGSTGLGLDIVHRTATASGGRLTIGQTPGGGTMMVATFGPAQT